MKIPDISLDTDAVIKGQGADPAAVADRNPGLIKIAQSALEMGSPMIKPVSFRLSLPIYSIQQNTIILENETRIRSSRITGFFCGAGAVEMVICTISDELEKRSADLFGEDAALALALDGLANAAVDKLVETICTDIEAEARSEGLKTSIPVSPGSEDWPLEIGQPFLFKAVKPDPGIIRLNDSFLMIPKKSASFMVGIGKEINKSGKTCDYCSVRETCRYKLRKSI